MSQPTPTFAPARGQFQVVWMVAMTTVTLMSLILLLIVTSPILVHQLKITYSIGLLVFAGCTFVTCQWRGQDAPILGPLQILLVSLGLKLVVTPVLHALYGLQQGNFPAGPSTESVGLAHMIYTAAALAATVGYLATHRLPRRTVAWVLPQRGVTWVLAVGLLGAGVSLVAELSRIPLSTLALPVTLAEALTPIAALLLVFVWPGRQSLNPLSLSGATAALALIVVLLFGSSRAAIIYPMIAAVAAYSLLDRRIKFAHIAAFAAVLLAAWLTAGQLRERLLLGNATYYSTERSLQSADVAYTLNNYFGASTFGGFALDRTPEIQRTLVPSLLESLPVVGEPFREISGSAVYNRAIYDQRGIRDQVYPAPIEVYRNLGALGIALVYLGLGALVAWLQAVFRSSVPENVLRAYIAAYLTILACAGLNLSVSVLGQFAFYNALPIVLFWLWVRRQHKGEVLQSAQAY